VTIGDGQELIDWLASRMRAPLDEETTKTNGGVSNAPSSATIPDETIIEKFNHAENMMKFLALFEHGDVNAYHGGDDSVADLALLSMLAFYTQDEAQLERIFSASALGQRDKWRRRDDYRKRTIRKALDGLGETYDWENPRSPERSHPIAKREVAPAAPPYIGSATSAASDDEAKPAGEPKLELITFAGLPAPASREFVISDLIPRDHATTLYGWGGTAKSLLAVLLGLSVAGERDEFLGRPITVHGPVLYLDFELDAPEQHRRVVQLACGMNMEVPEDFKYVSALGFKTHDAVEFALGECNAHDVVLVVLDSLGPAMVGDMAAARDVIEFHNCYIAPFKAIGVTPILVDHQARQQSGEGYQAKGAFGSAYKEHLSRSLIQVEAGDRSADRGVLNVRLRHKKTNFGVLAEPFDVSLSFSDEMIVAQVRDLTPADRAQEATLNGVERVVAALEDGPAYPDEISEATGLSRGTVKNKITALKKAGRVETTGEIRSQMEQVQLAAPAARPYKGSAASATPDTSTVAGFFANPPSWLPQQLEVYRENPELHLKPLCSAVAAELLGDGLRWEEVREEVRKEVGA